MSRKTCKRKVWGLVNPITHAVQGACITDFASLNQLSLRELSSLEAMAHGRGTLQEWCDLDAMVKICESAAAMGIGAEALPACETAKAELHAAALRNEATGRMGLSGIGIQALRDVYEYSSLQRQSISRAELERVIAGAIKKQRAVA